MKKIVSTILVLICVLLMCSCGLSDWTYDNLPGGYEIWRVNSNHIELIKPDEYSGGQRRRIDQYVLEFCSNETYIGAMCRPYIKVEESKQEDFDLYDAKISYYLVDTSTDTIYGPYTLDEYEKRIEELGIKNLSEWIKTYPKPEGAK